MAGSIENQSPVLPVALQGVPQRLFQRVKIDMQRGVEPERIDRPLMLGDQIIDFFLQDAATEQEYPFSLLHAGSFAARSNVGLHRAWP